jgi:hypothetical protein
VNLKKELFENQEARREKYSLLSQERKKIKDNAAKKNRVISEIEKLDGKVKSSRAAYEAELAETGVNEKLFKVIREGEDDLQMLKDTLRGCEAVDLKLNGLVSHLKDEIKKFDENELAIGLLELREKYESLASSLAPVLSQMQRKIVELCMTNDSFMLEQNKMPFEFAANPLIPIPKLFTTAKWHGEGFPTAKAERFHFIPLDIFNRAVNIGIPALKKELGLHPKQELSEVASD